MTYSSRATNVSFQKWHSGLGRHRRLLSAMLVASALLLLAGCGTAPAPKPSSTPSHSGALAISTATLPGIGTILVGPTGHVVYLLNAESAGHHLCTGQSCLSSWPALMLAQGSTLPVSSSTIPGTFSTYVMSNGSRQVTYNGWPLYYFAGDTTTDSANGRGISAFGGMWEAVNPAATTASTTPFTARPSPATSPLPATSSGTVAPTPSATLASAGW